jgi:hypothetical protein
MSGVIIMSEKFLSRLCYASTATAKCSSLQVGSILEAAFRNNAELDVTGALFFGNNYFLQFLEGPRDNVNLIYHKIALDDRHTRLQLLEFKEVSSRYFEEWSMKYVRFPHVIAKILRESRLKEFNPYLLDSFAVNGIAEAFRNHHDPEIVAPALMTESQPIPHLKQVNIPPNHQQQGNYQQIYHAYHEYHPQTAQSQGSHETAPHGGQAHKSRGSSLLQMLGLRSR